MRSDLMVAVAAAILGGAATVAAAAGPSAPDVRQGQIDAANRAMTEFAELDNGLTWVPPEQSAGFKLWTIGDDFDLDGPLVYTYELPEHERDYSSSFIGPRRTNISVPRPYECVMKNPPVLAFECSLNIFNGGSQDPPDLVSAQTAFDEPVRVTLQVLDMNPLTYTDLTRRSFGHGRIIQIQLLNNSPSPHSVEKAVQYFTSKYGAPTKVTTKYDRPQEVFSKECAATVDRVQNTPDALLSEHDRTQEKSCEAQAELALLSGKGHGGATDIRTWSLANDQIRISVVSSESHLSTSAGSLPLSKGVAIVISRNDNANVIAKYKAVMQRYTDTRKGLQSAREKSDF